MKIIFLDIDGVVNTAGTATVTLQTVFNHVSMINLKQIIEQTDSHIIISSSWRTAAPKTIKHTVLMSNFQEYGS